ncbi:transcriptional repressor NrdR [Candidatus Bathyarchaeota archaeon]|nr:transcriptional repressor NrdR [Candidatus Bathyarchaeota archaeon]
MKCPFCGSEVLRTLETRDSPNNMTRRRKICSGCGKRLTTYEYIEEIELMVRKKDGRLERFESAKILKGLQKACEKRPVCLEQMRDITEKVRQSIIDEGRDEVASNEIGDRVISHLKDLDYVCYVRFASVYREFREPEDFMKIVEEEKS